MEALTYLLNNATLLSLFFLMYEFLLKKETFFNANRFFLLTGITVASLFPLLVFEKIVYVNSAIQLKPLTEVFTVNPTNLTSTIAIYNVWDYAFWIYFGVAFILFFKFVIQLNRLFIFILKHKINQRINGITYRHTSRNLGPFSFFNTVVLNPNLYTAKELQLIKTHEEIHAKNWHSVDLLLANFLTIALWFNPLSWLYKKCIQENLEFIADNETVKTPCSIKNYQLILVKETVKNHRTIPVTNFHHSFIKKRIVMLHKSKSNQINFFKTVFILPLLALFLWSFQVKTVEKRKTESTKTNELKEGKTYIIKASTSAAELKTLKQNLEKELKETKIRFSKLKRNKKGLLTSIAIETMFNNESFHERVYLYDKDEISISEIYLQVVDKNLNFSTEENQGVTTTFTKEGSKIADLSDYKIVRVLGTKIPDSLPPCDGKTIYVFQDSTASNNEEQKRIIKEHNKKITLKRQREKK